VKGRALAAFAALLLGACGHAPLREAAPLPATAMDARGEIARLEARIAVRRDELGLPPPAVSSPVTTPEAAAGGAPQTPSAAPSEEAPPAPAAEEAERAPMRQARPAERSSSRVTAPRRSSRCRRVDEAAGEICDASQRICRLAEQIGDGDAWRSCHASRLDCARAGDAAARCF
jgi:hypothetical protein